MDDIFHDGIAAMDAVTRKAIGDMEGRTVRAYRCEVCDDADPHWTLLRRGDVVVSWACDADLATVAERLQRDNRVTELVVTDRRRAATRNSAKTGAGK